MKKTVYERSPPRKFTRWKDTSSYENLLGETFFHFDEINSFCTPLEELDAKRLWQTGEWLKVRGRYKLNHECLLARKAYDGGGIKDMIPDKIRRVSRRAKLDRIWSDRKMMIKEIYKTITTRQKDANDIEMKMKLASSLKSNAVKGLLMDVDPQFSAMLMFSKMQTNLYERGSKTAEREVYKVDVPSPAMVRESITRDWILGGRKVRWDPVNTYLFDGSNIHNQLTRSFMESFIDQDLKEVAGRLARRETLNSWNIKIAKKLAEKSKAPTNTWAKELMVDFIKEKVIKSGISVRRTASNGIEIGYKQDYARNLVDYFLNQFKDLDAVEAVMRGIYVSGKNKNWEVQNGVAAPYTLNELKQHLFKTKEGENTNDDIHHEVLKRWFMDRRSMAPGERLKIRLDCDSLKFLLENERNKGRKVKGVSRSGTEMDPAFTERLVNAISKLKATGEC